MQGVSNSLLLREVTEDASKQHGAVLGKLSSLHSPFMLNISNMSVLAQGRAECLHAGAGMCGHAIEVFTLGWHAAGP